MSNSGRREAVYVCVCVCVYACQCACIFLCLHIIWINTHRKEALKRLSSCRQQKRQTDLVHQMFCQLHNPFNQCNKQLFQHLSLSPPGHNSSFLSAYWRPSICGFSPLHIFHHSSFLVFFFFFPNESFQAWPLCVWKGPLRVTKTVNQSQITLSGLGHVSLVLNDRKKPEMDFREACDNSLHVLMWERILKYPSQWFRFFKTLTLFDKRDQGTTGRHLTGKVKCFTSYKTGNERKLSNTSVSRSEGPL